jgi:beta-glucanase (GH16 family)
MCSPTIRKAASSNSCRRRRLACVIAFALVLVSAGAGAGAGQGAGAQTAGDWKLVWADEFDTPGRPDPRNWTFETGFVRNNELQWYQPENARVENGLLIIEARRERRTKPAADYTSASLNTRGLHQWLYGRFEMRARIDTRLGLWPAFWTLGTEAPWPFGGEIDIMEYNRGTLLANVASSRDERGNVAWHSVKLPLTELRDKRWAEQFHVWRMDWDQDVIKLYVDDRLLNSVEVLSTRNGDGVGAIPFRQPQYLLLNLAVGGDAGGDPAETRFPARFEVDYVRVYQRR